MRAQPAPRLLQRVEHLVLGHGLVDPPLQDPLSPAPGQRDRLVGGKQRNFDPFQLSFDRESFVGAPSDARDALADHDVEPATFVRSLVEQVGDATVTSDRDVIALVVLAAPTLLQFHAPGLDVVEVRDDHPRLRDGRLAVPELPKHRLTRILLIVGGRPSEKRHPNLIAQQRNRHTER
ncbi:hypothetical protein ND450_28295 [Lentzea sp. HUAS12]|nr:hypothetical protein [Lentzea sp. HUAS12]USX49334.1 hypothetical protein ND450_28295 [Lentzea sp. HUAS12]